MTFTPGHNQPKSSVGILRNLFFSGKLNRLVVAFCLLLASTMVGIAGYMWIEGFRFVDALYLSIILLSTVGMNEIGPLSETGRMFTVVYILLNFSIFAYFISVITRYIFEGELRQLFKKYMNREKVNRLHDHIVVCGFGRYGKKVCEQLEANGFHKFLIVERDKDKVIDFYGELDNVSYIEGDATDDAVLAQAGIDRAKAVISTLPDDASNVYVVLSARELNPQVTIIARASSEAVQQKLRRAGADHVVMPDVMGGMQMANLIIRPEVVEFIGLLNGVGETKLRLDELRYAELKDQYRNQTIHQLQSHNQSGVNVIGFKDAKQGFLFNPDPHRKFDEGDTIIIIGQENSIRSFMHQFTKM
jgi:voltage-gated potassium channel